jgi:hypothetical protein
MNTQATASDILADLQDALMERLLAGRITARNLDAAFRLHVAQLTRAGFKQSEAADCFWDAVHTARYLREQEGAR